jgi:MSHA pilin protein MshD
MTSLMRRQAGFTLIELIVFIVVVAVGLVGILTVMNVSVRASADPMQRKQTLAIAESLMEEILLKEFANPVGGDTGSTRALFDDVDQYAGYTTTGGMKDVSGAAIGGLSSYNVTAVAVTGTTALTGLTAANAKQVSVTVTGPGGAITLIGYRANY